MTAETATAGRHARARLEAHRRLAADPGADLDQLTREVLAEMNAADDDHALDEQAAQAPQMTGPQVARLTRLFNTRAPVRTPPGPAPSRGRRKAPSLQVIAEYWAGQDAFDVDLDEPHCFGCGTTLGTDSTALQDRWNAASAWLDRAHLVDRARQGLDAPQNIVPLCRACHRVMPSFGPGEAADAITWVQAGGVMPLIAEVMARTTRRKPGRNLARRKSS